MFQARFYDLSSQPLGNLDRLHHAASLRNQPRDVGARREVPAFRQGFDVQADGRLIRLVALCRSRPFSIMVGWRFRSPSHNRSVPERAARIKPELKAVDTNKQESPERRLLDIQGFGVIRATSYSPTPLPAQYHRG
jgi:hypothetical protein